MDPHNKSLTEFLDQWKTHQHQQKLMEEATQRSIQDAELKKSQLLLAEPNVSKPTLISQEDVS